MARLARVVASDVPHQVTQRGNRRQPTFFCNGDYDAYLDLMATWRRRHGIEVWAYCLMPNPVHLVGTPPTEAALAGALGEALRRYTRRVNFREGWRGHLWQGRFASLPMDEEHLYRAVRYVELNPVRARLVRAAGGFGVRRVPCQDQSPGGAPASPPARRPAEAQHTAARKREIGGCPCFRSQPCTTALLAGGLIGLAARRRRIGTSRCVL